MVPLQDMWHINKCRMQRAILEDVTEYEEKSDSKKEKEDIRLQMVI